MNIYYTWLFAHAHIINFVLCTQNKCVVYGLPFITNIFSIVPQYTVLAVTLFKMVMFDMDQKVK